MARKWCAWRQSRQRSDWVASAKARSGRKPNKTRRRTICAGVIDRTAHFMKMKLEPQISPRAANAP
jgi:hypothetical protein